MGLQPAGCSAWRGSSATSAPPTNSIQEAINLQTLQSLDQFKKRELRPKMFKSLALKDHVVFIIYLTIQPTQVVCWTPNALAFYPRSAKNFALFNPKLM